MAEEAGAVRADAGRLEAGRQGVADERRTAADPLDTAFELGQPVGAVLLELRRGAEQRPRAASVRWHHDPMVEGHRAHLDRVAELREDGGGHRAGP